MIITLSGPPGSGATTTAKNIAINMSMDYHSAAATFDKIAKERKLTGNELRLLMLTEPTIDYEIDKEQLELIKKRKNIVVDSKLSAWKIDNQTVLRVYLHAPERIRAKRISQKYKIPISEAMEQMEKKEKQDAKRFMAWYGINIEDVSIYDLIINTEKWDPDGTLFIITKAVQRMTK